jgi:serine/threonine protein kinase
MTLAPGMRLGPYEVLATLGAGGMGQVYRARDTRLGRDVALKLMAEAHDGPQLTRFEQEARLAGSLNHPNVVVVFDVGSHEGTPYLVTELLQGETLRHRMDRGRIPLETALDWAAQVAKGLAAAHAQGVVHRDVKPENIFITRAGHVKLLDFGIAKLVEGNHARAPHELLHSTLTPSGRLTGEGQVVGTPRYMSPEQIRGGPVDARTDLFSLGTVLYEMATGERAFPGNTVVEAEYAILHSDPPTLPAGLPAPIAQLLRHCLEKDPDQRFQSATDLAFHLDAVRTPSGSILAARTRTVAWQRWWLVAPLVVLGLITLAIPLRPSPRSETLPSVRRLTFRNGLVTAARFGSDQRTVFFSATWNGEPEQVYSTTTDNPDYHPLGVSDARLQAVSASGELAILLHPRTSNAGLSSVTGTLAIVPGVGGVPREVAEDVTGASWSSDGLRMAITRQLPDGYRLEFPIGTTVYQSRTPVLLPRLAPSGERIAFVERRRSNDARGDLVVLEPGKAKRVLVADWEEVTDLAWTPAGDEVWFSGMPAGQVANPSLWAVSLRGDARLLYPATVFLRLEDVGRDGRAIARDGQAACDVGVIDLASGSINSHLAWFDWPTVAGISGDGKSLLLDEEGDAATAFGIASGSGPSWVFLQRTDGSPAVRLGSGQPLGLSPDGKWALVIDLDKSGRLWLLPTGAGARRSIDFDGLEFVPWWAHFSPDGRRAALAVRRPDGVQGYVLDLETAQARAITPPLRAWGPTSPDWRYLAAVPVDGEPTGYPIDRGAPRALAGIRPDDRLLGWTRGGLLAMPDAQPGKPARPPARIFRIDPASGARQLFTTLGPAEAPGADTIRSVFVTPDEDRIAYSYLRTTNRLFLFDFERDRRTQPGGK